MTQEFTSSHLSHLNMATFHHEYDCHSKSVSFILTGLLESTI